MTEQDVFRLRRNALRLRSNSRKELYRADRLEIEKGYKSEAALLRKGHEETIAFAEELLKYCDELEREKNGTKI